MFDMSSQCFHKQLEVSLVDFGEDLEDFWRLDFEVKITCPAPRSIQKSSNLGQRPIILLGFIRRIRFWCSHVALVQDLDEEGHGINPLSFFYHFLKSFVMVLSWLLLWSWKTAEHHHKGFQEMTKETQRINPMSFFIKILNNSNMGTSKMNPPDETEQNDGSLSKIWWLLDAP